MKNCNECGFFKNVGTTYEYYEGGCCVPEEFYTGEGCLLRFQEVKKLDKLWGEVESLSYGRKYYERKMTPELKKEEEEKNRAKFRKAYKEYDEYVSKLEKKYSVEVKEDENQD